MAIPTSRIPMFSTLENAISFLRFFCGSMENAAIPIVSNPKSPSIGARVAAAGLW